MVNNYGLNTKHSHASHDWCTPPQLIQMVRDVLVEIDLDPASSPEANQTVNAHWIIDRTQDGLIQPWSTNTPITVFCNPPGGRKGRRSIPALFWEKLITLRQDGLLLDAIFIAFSIESLQVTQNCPVPMTDFPICIPRQRIHFVGGDKPTHANAIIYVPGTLDRTAMFTHTFSTIGAILGPLLDY